MLFAKVQICTEIGSAFWSSFEEQLYVYCSQFLSFLFQYMRGEQTIIERVRREEEIKTNLRAACNI